MPGVTRPRKEGGKWYGWYRDESGKRRTFAGTFDRAGTLKIAYRREDDARLVREGLTPPGQRRRREAALRPLNDHIEDYKRHLIAEGDTPRHANHVAGTIGRLLHAALVTRINDVQRDHVTEALGRMRADRSPRTVNHALGSLKAFLRWLESTERIEAAPKGVMGIKPYSQQIDRRRIRRALTADELTRLLDATEQGPAIVATRAGRGGKPSAMLTGPDRAMLYRIAMGTGFRANELRSLTPESFDCDAATVTVKAAYSKRGRDDVQPITRALAERLRPWLVGKPPALPVVAVPEKTARMLAADLERAGIPVKVGDKVCDFHALRGSYITALVRSGANVKAVQKLARHSTVTLTLDTYTSLEDSEMRDALEASDG